MANVKVNIAGVNLKNPVVTGSGTFGYGREFAELYDLSRLGGVIVKGTTLEPRQGNPPPRIAETPSGMLNSVGLQNPGVEHVAQVEIPWLKQFDTGLIVNIAGHSVDDYQKVAERLDAVEGIDALEVNISCPNVAAGGMAFGTDPVVAANIVRAVRKFTHLPLIVKLSPNVTDIAEIAKAVEAAGADGISLINTLLGMVIDINAKRPVLANKMGGLSGPAVKPVAVRMVYQVAQAVKVPIIGQGGILTAEDAIEFLMAGATAVSVGAGNFYNPYTAVEVAEGISRWLDQNQIADVHDIIGIIK